MKRVDRAQLTEWIAGELCPGGQSINAMLEHVFLWCRDRRIYGPSRKELERVVCSQRQDYLDTWLIGASDRLLSTAVALLVDRTEEARVGKEGGSTCECG